MQAFANILKESIIITSFIFGMMILVEYFTVQTRDRFKKGISKNKWMQVIIGALLGIIPGCLGSYFAVTLYTHNVLSFPALTSVMIATSGDEAFAMLSLMPEKFLLINAILFVVAIVAGFILNLIYKNLNPYVKLNENLLKHHQGPQCYCFDKKNLWINIKNLSFYRFILTVALIILLVLEISGKIGPEKWYFRYTLIGIFAFGLFVVITVPEHFLKDHIWKHIVLKHLARIFLWIFVILLIIKIILPYLNISEQTLQNFARQYYWITLLIAVLLGIIPESGPHLAFLIMYSQGLIPLSILIANSISQDGHGSLPLIAESGKSFLIMKAINIFVALIIGLGLHLFGL